MNSIYETVCLRLRKSNCETMYSVSLIFPPRDNRGQNNEQSECLLCSQLFIPSPGLSIQIKKMKHDHKEKEQSKLELVVKALNVISK